MRARPVFQRRLSRSVAAFVVAATVAVPTAALSLSGAGGPAAAAIPTSELVAWGSNATGELGDGVGFGTSATPVQVLLPAGITATAVAGGGGEGDSIDPQQAGYAIGSDGNLYSWGDDTSGELGQDVSGGTNPTPSPVRFGVSGFLVKAVAAAQGSAVALGDDGSVYSWGDNTYGTSGDGIFGGFSPAPGVVDFPAGTSVTAVSAGYESYYALTSTGQIYAWGDNAYGELGNGTTTNSAFPTPVTLPAGVTATLVVGGGGTGYAIGSDGNLYAWGYNIDGGVGNGTTVNQLTPEVVTLAPGVVPLALAAGGNTGYAIGSDGNLYAWGNNFAGEVGNGTLTNQLTPLAVTVGTGVRPTAITADGGAAFVLGSDGKLYDWGNNAEGQLGNGTIGGVTETPGPVALPPGATPTLLGPGAGSQSAYVVISPGTTLVVTGQPAAQTVLAGGTATFTAAAVGSPTPTVQWQVSTDQGTTWSPVAGATDGTLTVPDLPGTDVGQLILYEAVFTSSAGQVTSNPASLTVEPSVAPEILTDPVDQSAAVGIPVSFTAAGTGTPIPTLQWQVSTDGGATFSPVTGATGGTLTIADPTLADNGNQYEAVFTNAVGTATTTAATLTVVVGVAPAITLQPTSVTLFPDQTATFTAAASGAPTPTVQWELSIDGGTTWAPAAGLTSPSFTSDPAALYENGWEVRAVFTNVEGSATTDPAVATVTTAGGVAPTVTMDPVGVTTDTGTTATFSSVASGTPTPTVQWQVSTDDGILWSDIPGATSTTFVSQPVSVMENGWEVRAVFTNFLGTAVSDPAVGLVPI